MTQQGSAPLNRPYQMQERLTLPSNSMMSDWMDEKTKRKKQAYGPKSFVANGPHHAYQLDLMFTQHLEDQQYDTAMVCIDAFSTYAAVAIIQGKNREWPSKAISDCLHRRGDRYKEQRTLPELLSMSTISPFITPEDTLPSPSGILAPLSRFWRRGSSHGNNEQSWFAQYCLPLTTSLFILLQRWHPRKQARKITSWMSMWIWSWRQSTPVNTLPSQ